jgi:hypothetical protein
LMVRETVAVETLASLAISESFILPRYYIATGTDIY